MDSNIIKKQVQTNCQAHEDHLCYIISQGFHLSDRKNYLALIKSPKFRCKHCNRQAVSDINLCVPVEF